MKKVILITCLLVNLHQLQFASLCRSVRQATPAISNMATSSLTFTSPAATSLNFNTNNLLQVNNQQAKSASTNYTSLFSQQGAQGATKQNKSMPSNSFMSQLKKMTFSLPIQQTRNISSRIFVPQQEKEGLCLHEAAHATAIVFIPADGELKSANVYYTWNRSQFIPIPHASGQVCHSTNSYAQGLQKKFADIFPGNHKLKGQMMISMAGVVAQQMYDPNYAYYHPAILTNLEDVIKMIVEYNKGLFEHYGHRYSRNGSIKGDDFANVYDATKKLYLQSHENPATNDLTALKLKEEKNNLYQQVKSLRDQRLQVLKVTESPYLPNFVANYIKSKILQETPEEQLLWNKHDKIRDLLKQEYHQKYNQAWLKNILELYPLVYRFLEEYKTELFTVKDLLLKYEKVDGKTIYDVLKMHQPSDYSGQGEHPGAQKFLERAFNPTQPKRITDPARLLPAPEEKQ
ncbi:MAG: hypothetical protein ACXWL5_03605 [Candidatus Chromulinivorax sp.]